MNKQINFTIENLPPMPRNRSHMVARNMLIKTPLAREFEKDLVNRLESHILLFDSLRESFNPLQHFLKVYYTIYTPKADLFTKSGSISLRAVDCDAHKVFQDVIFKCLQIDDKTIRNVTYFTPQSHDDLWNYSINIEVCDMDVLYV